jgi:alpha-L-fucosidase
MLSTGILLSLLPLSLGENGLVVNPKNSNDGKSGATSIPIDLSELVNNRAFGMSPGDANFDGNHAGYPAQFIPPSDFTYGGVDYIFPQYQESGHDNVLAHGQTITPSQGRYFSVHILAAAETGIATGFLNATYSDGSQASGALLVQPYVNFPYPYGGDLVFPYYLTNETVDYNRSMIFRTINWLDSSKELVSLQLPDVRTGASNAPGGEAQETRLHIFAVSMVPATDSGIALEVQYARSTRMWMEGTNKTQIFQVTVNNVGNEWILANNSVSVSIEASGVRTVLPGVINRLRPGDQAIVQVGVENTEGTTAGTEGQATAQIIGKDVQLSYTFDATFGIPQYEATFESIYSHESPMW